LWDSQGLAMDRSPIGSRWRLTNGTKIRNSPPIPSAHKCFHSWEAVYTDATPLDWGTSDLSGIQEDVPRLIESDHTSFGHKD
jgi:hypothetical protein